MRCGGADGAPLCDAVDGLDASFRDDSGEFWALFHGKRGGAVGGRGGKGEDTFGMKIEIATPEDLATDKGGIADNAPLKDRVIHALRNVFDPELPVNIYDLGLIYGLVVDRDGKVKIDMTLTAPNCPVADKLPADAATAVRKVEGVTEVKLDLVWEPKWSKDLMSDAARLELGWY